MTRPKQPPRLFVWIHTLVYPPVSPQQLAEHLGPPRHCKGSQSLSQHLDVVAILKINLLAIKRPKLQGIYPMFKITDLPLTPCTTGFPGQILGNHVHGPEPCTPQAITPTAVPFFP